jgi:hypothetical protein
MRGEGQPLFEVLGQPLFGVFRVSRASEVFRVSRSSRSSDFEGMWFMEDLWGSVVHGGL